MLPSTEGDSFPSPLGSSGQLLRNMVLFGRLLRRMGLDVTPTRILDLVSALDHVDLGRREDVKNTAQAVLVSHQAELALFSAAFDLFWQARAQGTLQSLDGAVLLPQPPRLRRVRRLIGDVQPQADQPKPPADEPPQVERIQTYSRQEALRHKDFAELSEHELAQVKQLMRAMPWNPETRRTRRRVPASRGALLDMRRTFRHNLRHGGEPLRLAYRQRKVKRRPLVVLCDVSGSMERYSRILVQFVYTVSTGLDRSRFEGARSGGVEAFVFSTRLTRITHQLRHRDVDQALRAAVGAVHDWGGGTRIGEILRAFNYEWGRRVLGGGAVVLIISDGWDRGDAALLDREMDRLQRSCHRLIWLNPLLGSPNYEPLTRGIQAALPHVDDFLPVHNLASLEQLALKLAESS